MDFMQQVVAEIELCDKATANKTLGQMRNEVRESLEVEQKMTILIKQIEQAETRAETVSGSCF